MNLHCALDKSKIQPYYILKYYISQILGTYYKYYILQILHIKNIRYILQILHITNITYYKYYILLNYYILLLQFEILHITF